MTSTNLDYPIYPLGMDLVLDEYWRAQASDGAINLCLGVSSFDPRPFAAEEWSTPGLDQLAYGDPFGDRDLREEIRGMLGRLHDVDVPTERIVITDGAQGALVLALLCVLSAGAEVVIPEIFYPGYPVLVRALGGKCVFASVNESVNVTGASIEAALSPKTNAVLLNSPGNPFSNVLSQATMDHASSLGLPVISDEVFTILPGRSLNAPTLLRSPGDNRFVVGGFSKAYAVAGLRMGYLVLPERARATALAIRTSLNLCAALPSQRYVASLLRAHDAVVTAHLGHLEERRRHFLGVCDALSLRLHSRPTRGFFGIILLDEAHGASLDVALALVTRHRVAVAPGSDFSEGDRRFLRVNYAGDMDRLAHGLSLIRDQLAS